MNQESDAALDVLRGIWTAQDQADGFDEACGTTKSCKSMANVGFDALAGEDGDLQAAWRAKLAREGKLNPEVSSVRDLVLGIPEPSNPV
jgi:hypothetical protein